MSGELIAILAVGVALVGVILTSLKGTETRLREDMAKLESRLDRKIGALESQIGELRERMAHLERLLEGLREAITGRAAAG